MELLRSICAACGFQNPKTLLQSGNVVFDPGPLTPAEVAERLCDAIEREAGFRTQVMVRDTAELEAVVAMNPFAGESGIEPAKLLVTFLETTPSREAIDRLLAWPGPERVHAAGRELYAYFPEGIGRSKLAPTLNEKRLGTAGTGRNWSTVLALLEMCRAGG